MKAIIPILTALSLAAAGSSSAADFFGVPDKTVVPKPATPAPGGGPATAPASATPAPAAPGVSSQMQIPGSPPPITTTPVDEAPPILIPDAQYLKTPTAGGQRGLGKPFRDLGPDHGVLIGFEYTVGTGEQGQPVIDSLTPFYVRSAGKARGILRGTPKPGNPATVLEARPGFAVAAVEVKGTGALEAFRVTFMRYENGAIDPAERYQSKWIGGEGGEGVKALRTDRRPIVGVYGKADKSIHELGFIVRKEIPPPPKKEDEIAIGKPVDAPVPATPGMPATTTDSTAETTPASPLTPTVFDPSILKTEALGSGKGKGAAFRDLAPIGSLLVGLDYAVEASNGQRIGSLRPLYLLSNGGKKLGDPHGDIPTDKRADARPGYAVGAITARGDFMLRGFQLTFMRIKGAGLDPADSYQSDWIGGKVGATHHFDGASQPIIGLYGKTGANIEELGAFVKKGSAGAPGSTAANATPAIPATTPPAAAGGIEVFACADDEFTLFLNGREILTGANLRSVQTGLFPIVKGDVLTAVVKDKGGGGGEAWFSLRVVRDGKTVLDAGDMRYLLTESLNWKTTKLLTGFREPKVWTHNLTMGADTRPRAAWAGAKDTSASVLYFKAVVP